MSEFTQILERVIDRKPDVPSPQNREEALFQATVRLTGTERAAFLNGACLGDNALRQRLEALLAAHDQPDNLVPTQAEAPAPRIKLDLTDAPDEAVGQTLGRYKLLERVGEGGCGVVYVAEQTEPVRRRVALKVIKLGMDTKQVVARFEAERQAQAMTDHPNASWENFWSNPTVQQFDHTSPLLNEPHEYKNQHWTCPHRMALLPSLAGRRPAILLL